MSHDAYKKGLNKNDPFDQLIMELAQKGVLDVSAVEIQPGSQASGPQDYSKKLLPHRGKHASQ
jgi:hypothetical protein